MYRTALIALVMSAAFAQPALAMCDRYGNCYLSGGSSYSGGGSSYQGYNSGTGSNWGANTYGGTTYGNDSRGNNYSYSRQGGYYNYGTGESRSYDPYTGRRIR